MQIQQPQAPCIYLDYQASAPVDPRVVAVLVEHMTLYPGNPHADDHAAGWEAAEALADATSRIAGILGCDADEIIFTSGATEANNLALLGIARRAPENRRRLLVSAVEHKCVLEAAHAAQSLGFEVEYLPVDERGAVRLDILQDRLAADVLLVSVMTVNNEIGTIEPVAEVARLCREVGALLHTDAAQAFTASPVTVEELGADMLSLSGHKLYAPKGIGALYIRRELQPRIEPLLYGGGQQQGLRSGTVPEPLCAALAEALALLCGPEGVAERGRIRSLRDTFLTGLRRIAPDARLNGPEGDSRHPGNANVAFPGHDARDLLGALQPRLLASTGSACTSGTLQPSYVLRAIGRSDHIASASIRFSMGRFTTNEDIALALQYVEDALVCTIGP